MTPAEQDARDEVREYAAFAGAVAAARGYVEAGEDARDEDGDGRWEA